MIYTTYFAQLRNLPKNVIPVSICGEAPAWYDGIQYKKLAPKWAFFQEWKRNHDNNYYIKHFNSEVLEQLNALRVITELQCRLPEDIKAQMDAPFYNSPDWHIALVCYEKPTDFCHRHLVSKWLCENGFECHEWIKE